MCFPFKNGKLDTSVVVTMYQNIVCQLPISKLNLKCIFCIFVSYFVSYSLRVFCASLNVHVHNISLALK